MLFSSTQHVQKRDLIWGCYTKIQNIQNPFYTQKVTTKNVTIMMFFNAGVVKGVLSVLFKLSQTTDIALFITGCVFLHDLPSHLHERAYHKQKTSFMTHKSYKKKFRGGFWGTSYVFTEYKFNIISVLPCKLFFFLYNSFFN